VKKLRDADGEPSTTSEFDVSLENNLVLDDYDLDADAQFDEEPDVGPDDTAYGAVVKTFVVTSDRGRFIRLTGR